MANLLADLEGSLAKVDNLLADSQEKVDSLLADSARALNLRPTGLVSVYPKHSPLESIQLRIRPYFGRRPVHPWSAVAKPSSR